MCNQIGERLQFYYVAMYKKICMSFGSNQNMNMYKVDILLIQTLLEQAAQTISV